MIVDREKFNVRVRNGVMLAHIQMTYYEANKDRHKHVVAI